MSTASPGRRASSRRPATRSRDLSAVHFSTSMRPEKPAVKPPESLAPNRPAPRNCCLPRRLPRKMASSLLTRPRPVRPPCPHGLNRTWASSAASAVASLATRRQNPRCLNGGDQRRGPEDANPMPRPLHQLLLGKIRQQRLSSRFFFGGTRITSHRGLGDAFY